MLCDIVLLELKRYLTHLKLQNHSFRGDIIDSNIDNIEYKIIDRPYLLELNILPKIQNNVEEVIEKGYVPWNYYNKI